MAEENNKINNSFNNLDKDIIKSLDPEENPKILGNSINDFNKRLPNIRRKTSHRDENGGDLLSLGAKVTAKEMSNSRKNKTVSKDERQNFVNDFIKENIDDQDFSTEVARISRYDDYRIIDKFIPEISASIDVFSTSIIAPDDTSKLSLMYRYKSDINENNEENRKVKRELDRIVEKYDLNKLIYPSVREGLMLGDLFYIIKDTRKDFEEILTENDDVLGRESSSVDDAKVINESFLDEEINNEDLDILLKELNNHIDEGSIYKDEKNVKLQKENFKNEILKSINENVEFFKNSSELLSDVGKYKGSNDLQSFLDKAQGSNRDKKIKSGTTYFRNVNPEDMIKLEVDGLCIGYLYIEPDSGTDIRGGANPLLSAMNGIMGDGYQKQSQMGSMPNGMGITNLDPVTGNSATGGTTTNSKNPNAGMNATSGSYFENGNTLMAYQGLVDVMVKGIAQKIDMDFVNKNDSFKDVIYRLIRKNYIIENGIKLTYLEPEEVVHHKLDSQKTYGVSRLYKSLFFAKLYLSTLITTMMVKINQSRDRRVFRVKSGLDDDYEGTVEEVIRNVRSSEMSSGMFGDGTSVQTMFNQVGNLENMYIPENKDGNTPLEIDTISGIQIDINDEFLEWLKKSVISGTGVPLNYIDSEAETDYARSLAMQNNGFVRKVVNYQNSFGDFFTKVLRRLYYLENKETNNDKDYEELLGTVSEIEAYFPPPVFLNLGNLNEEVGAVTQMLDFLVPLYTPETEDETENDKLKRLFRKELVTQEFMSNLSYDRFENIIENVKKDIEKDNKEDELSKKSGDDSFGSDDNAGDDSFGSDDNSDDNSDF
ncbi:portal vertex protein [Staphylococcus phage Machias]|nr:portal vertex protein [Staphylococcus phage Machias]